MSRKVSLTRQVPIGELRSRYRKEENSRVKERLLAMLHLYEGRTIREASRIVKRSERSIGRWVRDWNEHGYDGLIPVFTGGPKPRLASSEWDRIIKEIENKGMTIKDVTVYVKDTRGVHYAYKTVWEVLRMKKHVRYGKPYKMNRKRPDNAEEVFKKGWMNLS